jgi:hypothetical protein
MAVVLLLNDANPLVFTYFRRAGAEARPYEQPEGMSLAEFRCRSSERQFKRFLPRRVRGKKHFSAHKRARFARALQ